jgi:ABC-type sugar transport system ATPase subunit
VADLALSHVSKRFGRQAVIDDVSLSIRDGDFAVLVGPSGCGKSTLLRLIAGLEGVSVGEIRIGGELVNDWTPRERAVAMVFQSYALYPHMSVYDNIAFGLASLGGKRTEIDWRVRHAAERLQIADLLPRLPKALSGGQRQRVAIGRAIVREPKVFLFDEPLSNLDASLRTQMRLEFMQLHRELGTTIVYVTHDQAEAMTLASVMIVLRKGRVEQIGAPVEIYERPVNRFVAQFIGSPSMNMIEGRLESADADTAKVALGDGLRLTLLVDARRCPSGSRVTLGVRPGHLRDDADGNALPGTVVAVEHLGGESLIHAKIASGAIVTCRTEGVSKRAVGESIQFGIDPARCHLFDEAETALPRLE